MQESSQFILGHWGPELRPPTRDPEELAEALARLDVPLCVVQGDGVRSVGVLGPDEGLSPDGGDAVVGYVGPCDPRAFGDPTFCTDHAVAYPYVAGAMANGIASEELVEAMGRAGMLAFFGAAGLSLERVEEAVDRIQESLPEGPYGFNLIHSPNESRLEDGVVDLYLRRVIRLVEASAYMKLTLPVVRYRVTGIHRDTSGTVVAPNRIVAKVSREEVATHFMSPPPEKLLRKLVEGGTITAEQAEMASEIPMAQDITAEADSGGHTDRRPALSLLPTLCALRDRIQEEHRYPRPLRVGLAGGIATPASAVAAFAMGAAYVMTGTVNQACVESGSSNTVRQMLAEARQADVTMAPAADMFEMGVTVQVLKRGTMFPMRATKFYQLYRAYNSLDEIPQAEREKLEKSVLQMSFEDAWQQCKGFFQVRDPRQLERAAKDPKHKMALVFRSYLGQSSTWANAGVPARKMDYQIWCGPAMGAFNEWVRGSFLENVEERRVVTVAMNILHGAAVLNRVNALKAQGVVVPSEASRIVPKDLDAFSVSTVN